MCQQTDLFHLACQHRFSSPGSSFSPDPSKSSTSSTSFTHAHPPAFTYCAPLIAHRAKTRKLNFFIKLFHNHYKPCDNFCLETRVVEGYCPTCAWQKKEEERVRAMVRRGEVRKRTLGLVRTDDWDEGME